MPSQVPIWIPLAVALVGVIGIIAGQFVNAWREDRRWKHEQEREELRWRRAKATENAKLQLEHTQQWRETKIRIYGSLIRLLDELEKVAIVYYPDSVRETLLKDGKATLPTLPNNMRHPGEIINNLLQVIAEAQIVATSDVNEMLSNVGNLDRSIGYTESGEPLLAHRARSMRLSIVPIVRAELGIHPTRIQE